MMMVVLMQELCDENVQVKQNLQGAKADSQIAGRQCARSLLATDFRDLAEYGPKDAPALQAEMMLLVEQHKQMQVRSCPSFQWTCSHARLMVSVTLSEQNQATFWLFYSAGTASGVVDSSCAMRVPVSKNTSDDR